MSRTRLKGSEKPGLDHSVKHLDPAIPEVRSFSVYLFDVVWDMIFFFFAFTFNKKHVRANVMGFNGGVLGTTYRC